MGYNQRHIGNRRAVRTTILPKYHKLLEESAAKRGVALAHMMSLILEYYFDRPI